MRWQILYEIYAWIISDLDGEKDCTNWSTKTKDISKMNVAQFFFDHCVFCTCDNTTVVILC